MIRKNKNKTNLVFNPATLSFEQKKISLRNRIVNIILILSGVLVFSFFMILISHKIFPSPKESELNRQILALKKHYSKLENHIKYVNYDLKTLRKRDEDLYRVIYQKDPIDNGFWKIAEFDSTKYIFKEKNNIQIIADLYSEIKILKNKFKLQNTSYNELSFLVSQKDQMINSIPSIQPIANKDLNRISSGFGFRIHPIYRIPKMHTGIDFTAQSGTLIYAAGDGIIEKSTFASGYGNEVVINHGYGYRTRYAHLSKFLVSQGTKVKRGQQIGCVGSTGASVGPHLHYEVEYNGSKVDPALFFYNDLSPSQYEKLMQLTNSGGKAFD